VQQAYVHLPDVIELMDRIPIYVTKLLHWGSSLDNPVNMREGELLRECLIGELQRQADTRRRWKTDDLIGHMKKVGAGAFAPVVVLEKRADRLETLLTRLGMSSIETFCASGRRGAAS
jgi:hypothetical protein